MSSGVAWDLEVFDLNGQSLAIVAEAYERSITFEHNGIDQLEFSLYLDDPVAGFVVPIKSVVKVWRRVRGLPDPVRSEPFFCGVVGPRRRGAREGTVTYTAFSPLWRLQHRYHIDKHVFGWWNANSLPVDLGFSDVGGPPIAWDGAWYTNPDDRYSYSTGWNPSWVMWAMIHFTNELVPGTGADRTGIIRGAMEEYLEEPLIQRPWIIKRYGRGQNTWTLVDEIVNQMQVVDLAPRYTHVDGLQRMMYFDTVWPRGVQNDDVVLGYGTAPWNCADVTDQEIVEPGTFATHVTAQGQGERDTDRQIAKADGSSYYNEITGDLIEVPDYLDEYGLYMRWDRYENETSGRNLRSFAAETLLHNALPVHVVEPTVEHPFNDENDAVPVRPVYGSDYGMGDGIRVRCDRDTMRFGMEYDEWKRVLGAKLTMSDGNLETTTLTLVDDAKKLVTPDVPEFYGGGTTPGGVGL